MEKIRANKKLISIVVLVVVALISMFVLSTAASSPKLNQWTINELDEKKTNVMEFTTITAATATALAAAPSDFTTPVAQQIMEIGGYLFIVVCLIVMEKIIVSLTGYITFGVVIPAACFLTIVYLLKGKEQLKSLAIKLVAFGVSIFLLIPSSIFVGNVIENTLDITVEQAIEQTEIAKAEIDSWDSFKESVSDNGFWNTITGSVTGFTDKITEKLSNWLSRCIDTVAVLLISNLVIPVGILFLFIWLIKALFGINVNVKSVANMVVAQNKKFAKSSTGKIGSITWKKDDDENSNELIIK